MQKASRVTLSIVFLCILISMVLLGYFYVAEAPFAHSFDSFDSVHIVGTYRLPRLNETFALTENTRLVSDKDYAKIEGHFTKDIPKGSHIIFRVDNAKISIYINNVPVYMSAYNGSYPAYSDSPGNFWDGFVSDGISVNDRVSIDIVSVYPFRASAFDAFLSNIYFGGTQQLFATLFSKSAPAIICSLIVLILGLLVLIASVVLWLMGTKSLSAIYLSLAAIAGGVWFFINFRLQSILLPLPVFNNIMDMTFLTLVPPLVVLYISSATQTRLTPLAYTVAALNALYTVTALVLQASGFMDFYATIPFYYVLLFVTIATMLFLVVYEALRAKNRNARFLLCTLPILVVGALLDALCMMTHLTQAIMFTRPFAFIFIIVLLINSARVLRVMIIENTRTGVLREMAYADALTALPNKAAYNMVVHEIELGSHRTRDFSLAVLDINSLKATNDTYGHEAGDELIRNCARIISAVFTGHRVYRIGGDEFAVLLLNENTSHEVYYNKLQSEIESAKKRGAVMEGIACGFAVFDKTSDTSVSDVFRRADEAMYNDKHKTVTYEG